MQINLKNRPDLNNFSLDIIFNQYVSVGSDWNHENCTSFFSRLYYIESGCGRLYHNGKETLLLPGNIYFIPTGTCFSYHCTDETTMKKLFFHLLLIYTKEQHDIFSDIAPGIYSITADEANSYNIFKLYHNDDYSSLLSLKSIIFNTLGAFYDKYNWNNVEIKQYSRTVHKIMEYIQTHLSMSLTIKEIADALFLSEGTISKVFKTEKGITIGEYIDTLIFTKANHLLLKDDYTLKDISHELGFCDQFYFSRRFKEKFGHSPQQYRKTSVLF